MIIFPRRQWNANNLVTAHLADDVPPSCALRRPMKLCTHTWNFAKIICTIIQFPCLNFSFYLHYQDPVSDTALGHPATQNVMSSCDLCTHTLCSFIECCVSQKMWALRSVLYNIFVSQTHERSLTTWQKRNDASASGRWVLLQHQQKVN